MQTTDLENVFKLTGKDWLLISPEIRYHSWSGKNTSGTEMWIKKSSLTPVKGGEFPYFEKSSIVIRCKKISRQKLDNECFIDPSIEKTMTTTTTICI